MKRKKIILFLEYFLASTETFIYNQLKVLAKNNDVLVLCCETRNNHLFPYDKIKVLNSDTGFRKKWQRFLLGRFNYYVFRDAVLKNSIQRELAVFKPDLIFSHFGTNALLWYTNVESFPIIPHFILFHGYDASFLLRTSRSYRNKLNHLLNQKSIFPLFVSKALHKNAESLLKNKILAKITYLGIDTSIFNPQNTGPAKGPITFIQVASFVEKKGQKLLLRALHKIRNMDFNMIFIGDGPLLSHCKTECNDLGLSEKVSFLGYQSKETIKEQLENSDVFVHPSCLSKNGDSEGLPTSIMEAMAMELPILTTRHSGIPELVENGIHGILVNEKDVEALTYGLIQIMGWKKMGNNRIRIEQDFNLIKQCKKLEEYFNRILSISA